jgi:hypothetical protein
MERRAAYPNRKISETFLDFAAPMLDDLPSEATEQPAKKAFEVSFTVWNAVVFADVLNDHRHLEEIRRLTAGNPETALLMEQLITRKRALFADDERLIGTWEFTRTEDGINLRADARDPHTLPRDPT